MIRPASTKCFHHTERPGKIDGVDVQVVETRLGLRFATALVQSRLAPAGPNTAIEEDHIQRLLLALRREVGAEAWGQVDDAVARENGDRDAALEEGAWSMARAADNVPFSAALRVLRIGMNAYRDTLAARERGR